MPASGFAPGDTGIDRLNNKRSTSCDSTFITEAGVIREVTLRDSGPCH